MNSSLARKDLWVFQFPKSFIPEKVNNFYNNYLNRIPTYCNSVRDFTESTLQSINLPSYSYESKTQGYVDTNIHNHITYKYRDALNFQDLTDKKLELTFKLTNGYLNYWVLQDSLDFHYASDKTFVDDYVLHITDNEGNIMFSRVFRQCTFTGISDLELNYSTNSQIFETFTITLEYSTVETQFNNSKINGEFIETVETK